MASDQVTELRAWARGMYATEAAVELLARAFNGRFTSTSWGVGPPRRRGPGVGRRRGDYAGDHGCPVWGRAARPGGRGVLARWCTCRSRGGAARAGSGAPRRGAKVVTSRSACFCGSQPTARGRVLPNVIERSAPPESGFGQLLCAPSCCRIGSRIRAIEPTARKRTAPKVIVAAKPVRCTPNPARSGPSASPPA